MQTIGEAANKRGFVPSQWTDILFESLSGKADNNYTIDVKIGTKRIATDNQEAKESPKKRRKQSNPTRISSDGENANRGAVTESSGPAARSRRHSRSSSPLNLTKHENEIPSPGETAKRSDDARPSADVSKDPTGSPCPQLTATVPSYSARKDGSCPPESFARTPFANQRRAATADPVRPPSVQIFNPEAFCDRCNKEFCNKYFLKTHKANKHGVLVDNYANGCGPVQDPSDSNRTTRSPTAAGDATAVVPSSFKSPVALVPQPPTNAYAASKLVQMAAAAAAVAGNQTRAYCSVCHKEFCNKYFVKRHKAKIHGITDDGDTRPTASDDAPLNFKTAAAVEFENEDSDTCDKYETVWPADDVRPPAAAAAANVEYAATSVIVRAPCDYNARAERRRDDDHYDDDHDHVNDHVNDRVNETGTDYKNAGVTGCPERDDGTSTARERACHGCRQTCDSDGGGGGGASTGSGNSAETDGQQSAALSSFCRICNKELCNKYFMKTHMQRMHGISIRHGNHIGGVVCDVCNKELCSKYFLRVHKQNSHGIAAENGVAACPKPPWPENAQPAADEPAPDGGHAYYRRYAEACDICFRRFRSPKWLAAHLLNDHGDEGRALWGRAPPCPAADDARPATDDGRGRAALKQYRCSYCPFATSVLSFLFVHEKFHVAEDKAAAAGDRRAVPEPVHEPFIMQSFFLENCSVSPSSSSAEPESAAGRSDSFHSSLVYLPVKEKLTSTVNVFFKLTPA